MRWKRAAGVVCAGAMVVAMTAPVWAADPPPTLSAAPEAALYDPANGSFLYERAANREVPVASLTKLMTARLLLESGKLGETATVPAAVTALPETKAGLVPGQRLPMQTLLEALLVRSANDAAYTVAVNLAGSETAFADEMNAEAARLGLAHTHYVNSSGLDAPGQYSSAADSAVLAASDMTWEVFRDDVDMSSVQMPDGEVYRTVNPFLAYYASADGIKTGFTTNAGFCLVASAVRNGQTLIAVVLGAPNWPTIDADAARLLNWGFAQLPPISPAASAAPVSPPAAASKPSEPPPAPPATVTKSSATPASGGTPVPASGTSTPKPASSAGPSASAATGALAVTPRVPTPLRQAASGQGHVRVASPARHGAPSRFLWPMLAAVGICALALSWLELRRR